MSPLLFSLFVDQLDGFLQSHVVAWLSSAEQCSVQVVGLLIPALLFANDPLLLGTSCRVV